MLILYMRNVVYIVSLVFMMGCASKATYKINYKLCSQSALDLLKSTKDSGLYVTIIDNYEFETEFSNKKVVQFLFKIEDFNDTFCLFEYRKLSNECPIAPVNNSYSDYDWDFQKLDTSKLKSHRYTLLSKGKISYSRYNQFNTIEGYFGCSEDK